MTSKYPGMSKDLQVHPKGANIHKKLKLEVETSKVLLETHIRDFVDRALNKFTKVKFMLIFTKSEFAIGAYRNAGSKAYFYKLVILTGKHGNAEFVTNDIITKWEVHTKLSLLDTMITVFGLFGGQIPLKFEQE